MASDDKKQVSPQPAPVELMERLALVGKDFGTISKAAIVPGVIVLLISLFIPAAVEQAADPQQAFYQACIRTFPLTVTIAIIVITLKVWLESKGDSFSLFWLVSIWAFSLLISFNLASHFGCTECGNYEGIRDMEYSWLPGFLGRNGLDAAGMVLTAPVYFFKLFGPASFVAALICGSFLAGAGLYLLRRGGPLVRKQEK